MQSSWKERRAGQAQWGSAALSLPDFSSGKGAGLQTRGGGSGSALHSAIRSVGCSCIHHSARSACSRGSERHIASVAAGVSHLWSLSRQSGSDGLDRHECRDRLPGALAVCRPAFSLSPHAPFNDELHFGSLHSQLQTCLHLALCVFRQQRIGSTRPQPGPCVSFATQL